MEATRLPRAIEDDPEGAHLGRELASRAAPLWAGGELRVAQAEIGAALGAELRRAFSAGQLARGLEAAERKLAAEARGLSHVDQKTGVGRGRRVSRLLLLADDGAERFYRSVESLLRRHAPRVLAVRLAADQGVVGQLVFGPDQVARLLLVEHKAAVSGVLLALASQWRPHHARFGPS